MGFILARNYLVYWVSIFRSLPSIVCYAGLHAS